MNEKFPKVYSSLDEKYYLIQCRKDEPSYPQRRRVLNTTDSSLMPQEIVIIALCDSILDN